MSYYNSNSNSNLENATTTQSGLMSQEDKTKLDNIDDNANNYTLPTATSSTLGGVKTGSNITNTDGTISLTKNNVTSALGYTPANSSSSSNQGIGFIDTDNIIISGTATSSYTATQDCWVECYKSVCINDIHIITFRENNLIPLKKGQTIKTTDNESSPSYSIFTVFGMKY